MRRYLARTGTPRAEENADGLPSGGRAGRGSARRGGVAARWVHIPARSDPLAPGLSPPFAGRLGGRRATAAHRAGAGRGRTGGSPARYPADRCSSSPSARQTAPKAGAAKAVSAGGATGGGPGTPAAIDLVLHALGNDGHHLRRGLVGLVGLDRAAGTLARRGADRVGGLGRPGRRPAPPTRPVLAATPHGNSSVSEDHFGRVAIAHARAPGSLPPRRATAPAGRAAVAGRSSPPAPPPRWRPAAPRRCPCPGRRAIAGDTGR